MTDHPFFLELPLSDAFVGARAQRLAELIGQQGDEFLQAAGVVIPARSVSTLLYLHHEGSASLVEIAKALRESHQLTAQRTSLLNSLGMISSRADENDGRRRVFSLTRKGKREAAKVQARCTQAIAVFDDLNRELASDLARTLDAAYDALRARPMLARSTLQA
ncbi:MAG: hypothetical protein AAF184_10590 [Pseudomonadota bacterium]